MSYYRQGQINALTKLGFPITSGMSLGATAGGAALGGLTGSLLADKDRVGSGNGLLIGALGGAVTGYHGLEPLRLQHLFSNPLTTEAMKINALRKQLLAVGPEILGTGVGAVGGALASDPDSRLQGAVLGGAVGSAAGAQGAKALEEVRSFVQDVKHLRAARAAQRAEPFKIVNIRPATPRALPSSTTKVSFASPERALVARIAAGALVGGGTGALIGPSYGKENAKYKHILYGRLNKNRFQEQSPERIKELRIKGLIAGALLGGAVSGGSKSMAQRQLSAEAARQPMTKDLIDSINKGFW